MHFLLMRTLNLGKRHDSHSRYKNQLNLKLARGSADLYIGIMIRQEIIGLDEAELKKFVTELGQAAYRGTQIFCWLYGRQAASFEEMTNLSAAFRRQLREHASLQLPEIVQHQRSSRGDAEKFLLRLADETQIETVLMHEGDRHTLCISSQVGCPIDCKFCATGKMGLIRNLHAGEIAGQLLRVQRLSAERISNVVIMGMGEPLNNYDAVIKACYLMTDEQGLHLSKRHIVISTSGLIPQIRRFAQEGHKFRLAISLNATTDELRTQLMPLNKRYPIADLIAAAKELAAATHEAVTFEYVLLDGVNDSLEDTVRLKTLLRGLRCKINLIPFNAMDEHFRRPSQERIAAFYGAMQDFPAPVTLRWSKGDDIDAACGQLWTKSVSRPQVAIA